MLIPIGTDAPVYHLPVVTVGLIAINTAVFFLVGQPPEWMLSIGNGWHPAQWVTAAFLHANAYHLVGNMIFLWAYGLVIEGKIGWWRFLITYLLIGVTQHLAVQTLFGVIGGSRGSDQLRYVLGASGAISGLMAIALLWAPENSFTVVWGYKWGPFASATDDEMSILGFSLWFIGWDLLAACLYRFPLCAPVLHIWGVVVGLIAGVLFLQRRWVDCENYDVFTRWSGRRGTPLKQLQRIWNSARHTLHQRPKPSKAPKCRHKIVSQDKQDADAEYRHEKKSRQTRNVDWRTIQPMPKDVN
jgi:membrane associated rhomboid family serine protease